MALTCAKQVRIISPKIQNRILLYLAASIMSQTAAMEEETRKAFGTCAEDGFDIDPDETELPESVLTRLAQAAD